MGPFVRVEREKHILWSVSYLAHSLAYPADSNGRLLVTAGFTPLLAKDSNNHDPARVINISSIAALSPISNRSKLAGAGNGLWSCQFSSLLYFHEH
jgi:hypothetical protein